MSDNYSPKEATEILYKGVLERLMSIKSFSGEFNHKYNNLIKSEENGLKPMYHQVVRTKTFLDYDSVLLADDTGCGKTFVPLMGKAILDYEKQKRHQVLVFCPKSGMISPWNEDEINSYLSIDQRLLHINRKKDFDRLKAETFDFIVFNYEKLNDGYLNKLLEYKNKFDLLIFDECHQLKNNSGQWNNAIKTLFNEYRGNGGIPKRILLSATPIPNRLNDIGMVLYMLDPDLHPNPRGFIYEQNPQVIANLFAQHRWHRITKQELRDYIRLNKDNLHSNLKNLPDLPEEIKIPIKMNKTEAQLYLDTYKRLQDQEADSDDKSEIRSKLISLERILSNYQIEFTGDDIPSKYLALEKLLNKGLELNNNVMKISNGEKLLIFSRLQAGLSENLQDYLNNLGYKTVRVDGTVSQTNRGEAIEDFRYGDAKVLVATIGTLGESVSLSTGKKPCSVLLFEPFFALKDWIQTVGRVYRPGQEGDVRLLYFIAHDDQLKSDIQDFNEAFENEMDVRRKKKIEGRTIDEDKELFYLTKKRVVERVYSGMKLEQIEKDIFEAKSIEKAVMANYGGWVYPNREAMFMSGGWIGKGKDYLAKIQNSKLWKDYVEFYNDKYDTTASANTARLLNQLNKEFGDLENIVDMGCGPGCMSRIFIKPMTCVDLSQDMLDLAKLECEKLGIKNRYVKTFGQQTGLDSNAYELAITSYVLHYQAQGLINVSKRIGKKFERQKTEFREINDMMIEVNRILKNGGYWFITLTYNLMKPYLEDLVDELGSYGFSVPKHGFFAPLGAVDIHGEKMKPIFKGAYALVAKKEMDCSNNYVTPLRELIHMRAKKVLAGGDRKSRWDFKKRPQKREIITDFTFIGKNRDVV